jgi:hypothetical protein
MRRFLTSILIITVFAVRNISFSHVHLPSGHEGGDHHSGRPHFHLHGEHSHAAHHHASQHKHPGHEFAATLRDAGYLDHDSDACYVPESLTPNSGLTRDGYLRVLRVSRLFILEIRGGRFGHHAFVPKQHSRPFAVCSGSIARMPLYLRRLAILC